MILRDFDESNPVDCSFIGIGSLSCGVLNPEALRKELIAISH